MLEIALLGEITIRLHGTPITQFRSQKELALLAYLAHTGHAHSREALAGLLWEARSTKQSLSNLRTALARLRKQAGDHLVVTRKTVAVTRAVHEQTDSVRFQALLAGMDKEGSVTAVTLLSQGLKLYSGEFMAGFSLLDAPRLNDWLVVEQERLRQAAMRGYRQLARWQEEQGAFTAGVVTAQEWVAWHPLDETAQQQLMRLLAYDGRISEALAVYEKCRQLLQTEMGIPPAPATVALFETIQAGSLSPPDISPAPLHNLPRALMPLYGRKKEIEKLTGTLIDPEYPLVSITAVGGMGKTSLALATGRQLAAAQPPPFKDGIWFVSLEEIENDTPEKVQNGVAALVGRAMGLYFHSESDLWTQLLGHLAAKNLLLILDNIEQFLTVATDLIMNLLEAGEDIHLLTTSRTTLDLAASIAFPLAGLETPAQVSAEALQNESVRLFAERAARMPSPFNLEKYLAEVVAICQFVEGMPLAIELAAASLGRLMIDEVLPALTNNLRLLDTTRRDLPPRQRTLHAVFDYTWQLLDPHEQTLLAQIAIFRGGFTYQAAAVVLNDTISDLYNLQDHALLNRDETGRFRIHPLLRQLAREKLNEPNRCALAEQALNQHAVYFTSLVQSFEKELQCGEGQEAIQTLLAEQANLRAAWQHAVQTGQWPLIANCLNSAHYFFQRQGFFVEEAALIDEAMTALIANLAEDDVFLTGLLSRLLTVRAWDYLGSAQFDEGVKIAEQACELAQKVANAGIEAQARVVLAKLFHRDHAAALAQCEQVVTLAKIAQDPILEADGWSGIGAHRLWLVDAELAREPLHHALNLCQTLQYKPGELLVWVRLAALATRQEALAQSIEYDEKALHLSRQLGDVTKEVLVLGNMGVTLYALGDFTGSQHYQEEALATCRRLNMPIDEQMLLGGLGHTAIQLGDYAAAGRYLAEALVIARQIKDDFWQAWVKLRLGEMWYEQGQSQKALFLITEAFQTAEEVQNRVFLAAVLYHWGIVLLNQADWAAAEEKFQRAYDLWQEKGKTENALSALAGLAYAAYQLENEVTAVTHAENLWQAWKEKPVWAERANLKLYWQLGMVWDGLGDSRANDVWKKVRALLRQRSEKILDEGARKLFLEQVPAHRAILQIPISLPV